MMGGRLAAENSGKTLASIRYSHPPYWRPADRLHGHRGGAEV